MVLYALALATCEFVYHVLKITFADLAKDIAKKAISNAYDKILARMQARRHVNAPHDASDNV